MSAATTCPLCWAQFPTAEELAQHEQMESMVDWPLDYDPSTNAETMWVA